jgi:hypothetical protein
MSLMVSCLPAQNNAGLLQRFGFRCESEVEEGNESLEHRRGCFSRVSTMLNKYYIDWQSTQLAKLPL